MWWQASSPKGWGRFENHINKPEIAYQKGIITTRVLSFQVVLTLRVCLLFRNL